MHWVAGMAQGPFAAAPNSQVAHGAMGCMVSINDLADRPPAPIQPDGSYDLGGKFLRNIDTPHVPHGWDAHVLYEETTGTLFCGDLFTHLGNGPALTDTDIIDAASEAEDVFGATCLTPNTAPTIRSLAALTSERLPAPAMSAAMPVVSAAEKLRANPPNAALEIR